MMIEIVGPLGALVIRSRDANPVDGKAGVILGSDIRVETAVVLFLRGSRGIERHILRDVGHAIEARPAAGAGGAASVGRIVCAQRSLQRRANIESLAGN